MLRHFRRRDLFLIGSTLLLVVGPFACEAMDRYWMPLRGSHGPEPEDIPWYQYLLAMFQHALGY
jgi:hypothetical protein